MKFMSIEILVLFPNVSCLPKLLFSKEGFNYNFRHSAS